MKIPMAMLYTQFIWKGVLLMMETSHCTATMTMKPMMNIASKFNDRILKHYVTSFYIVI